VKKVTPPEGELVTLDSGMPQTDAKEPCWLTFFSTNSAYLSMGQLRPGPEEHDWTAGWQQGLSQHSGLTEEQANSEKYE
jgi:hypothetical protein